MGQDWWYRYMCVMHMHITHTASMQDVRSMYVNIHVHISQMHLRIICVHAVLHGKTVAHSGDKYGSSYFPDPQHPSAHPTWPWSLKPHKHSEVHHGHWWPSCGKMGKIRSEHHSQFKDLGSLGWLLPGFVTLQTSSLFLSSLWCVFAFVI